MPPFRSTIARLLCDRRSLLQRVNLKRFDLERYPGWTAIGADRQLSCSDVEPLSLAEILARASPEDRANWERLSLAYPDDSRGDETLRRAIAKVYRTETVGGQHVASASPSAAGPGDFTVCVPAEGILLAMLALVQDGDRVVVTAPYYESLGEIARSLGAEVVPWMPRCESEDTEGDSSYHFHPDDLQALLTSSSSDDDGRAPALVVLNFPHNPTGALPTAKDFEAIVALCEERGARIFSDEMYRGLELREEARLPSAWLASSSSSSASKHVTLSGMSKAYSLPGLRLGWLATKDEQLLGRINELKDYTTICPAAPSSALATMALKDREHILARNLDILREGVAAAEEFFVVKHGDKFRWRPPVAGSVAFPALRPHAWEALQSSDSLSFLSSSDSSDSLSNSSSPLSSSLAELFCDHLQERADLMLMPSTVFAHAHGDGSVLGDGTTETDARCRVSFGRRNTAALLGDLDDFLRRGG